MTRKRHTPPPVEVISYQEYIQRFGKKKSRNKYSAIQVEDDGYVFDSKVEHRRYLHLRSLQRLGLIHDLEVHPVYALTGGRTGMVIGRFTPDFRYRDEAGTVCVEDVKGQTARLEMFRLRCKLLWDQEGIMVTVVTEEGRDSWVRKDAFPLPASMRREGRKRRNSGGR